MTHKGLIEPHILLASSNPMRLIKNLPAVLTKQQIKKIDSAISKECALLFNLGEAHFSFAVALSASEWRQRTSRLYYAAYNVKRAAALRFDGSFSTDSGDHSKIDQLPGVIANHATYAQKLKVLRDDRNLADYSHLAKEIDLVIPVSESESLVRDFIADVRSYLLNKGVQL